MKLAWKPHPGVAWWRKVLNIVGYFERYHLVKQILSWINAVDKNYQWDKIECKHQIVGIMPTGPYPPCLRIADRALLAGYPRNQHYVSTVWYQDTSTTQWWTSSAFDGLIVCRISAKLSHSRSQPPQVFLGNNIYRVTKCMALQRTTCVPHAHKMLMYKCMGAGYMWIGFGDGMILDDICENNKNDMPDDKFILHRKYFCTWFVISLKTLLYRINTKV